MLNGWALEYWASVASNKKNWSGCSCDANLHAPLHLVRLSQLYLKEIQSNIEEIDSRLQSRSLFFLFFVKQWTAYPQRLIIQQMSSQLEERWCGLVVQSQTRTPFGSWLMLLGNNTTHSAAPAPLPSGDLISPERPCWCQPMAELELNTPG